MDLDLVHPVDIFGLLCFVKFISRCSFTEIDGSLSWSIEDWNWKEENNWELIEWWFWRRWKLVGDLELKQINNKTVCDWKNLCQKNENIFEIIEAKQNQIIIVTKN